MLPGAFEPYGSARAAIAALIFVSSVAIVADKVVVPATTAAKKLTEPSRTRACPGQILPDGTRQRIFRTSFLISFKIICTYLDQYRRQVSGHGDQTTGANS